MNSLLEKPLSTDNDIEKRFRDEANNIIHKIQEKIILVQAFENDEGEQELWLIIADGKPRMKPIILCSGDCASESMLKFRTADFLEKTFGQYTKFYSYHMVQALYKHYCQVAESYSGQSFLLIDNEGVQA